jgi:hypothetical protein
LLAERRDMSVRRVRPDYDHIPLHRLWAFTTLQTDLTEVEETHLFECDECSFWLLACVKAKSFVYAFKQLGEQDYPPPLAKAS